MANLGNEHSGVVRSYRKGWIFTYLNNTVHNGKYVGMEDNNQDLHQEDDAHTWGRSQIIKYATPDEQGTIRHYCSVDGCKGYYEEFFDYVAPAEPVTPAPTDPDTPDVPGTSDSTPGTRRHTASATAMAGISPPVRTKSPMDSSSSTHSSMKRWSMPS